MNRSTILQAADPPSDESPRREAQPEKKKTASMRNNRHRIPRPLASVTLAMLLALPVMSAQTGTAFAEDRRFYVGVTVPVERLDTSYKKTVDNTHPSNRVPEPRRGMVFHDGDSDDTFAYGIGLLAGYRLPLTESGFYLSGEVDLAFHGGKAKGQLRGVGTSAGRNQPGESWPDRWSFEKDRSYGFTLKLGGSPGVLRSWDTSIYALGGIRLIQAQFTNHYNVTAACFPGRVHPQNLLKEQTAATWILRPGRTASAWKRCLENNSRFASKRVTPNMPVNAGSPGSTTWESMSQRA